VAPIDDDAFFGIEDIFAATQPPPQSPQHDISVYEDEADLPPLTQGLPQTPPLTQGLPQTQQEDIEGWETLASMVVVHANEETPLDQIVLRHEVAADFDELEIQDDIAAEVAYFAAAVIVTALLYNWGLDNPNWLSFLVDFPSAARYCKAVGLFFLYVERRMAAENAPHQAEGKDLIRHMIAHFDHLHNEKNIAPTTLRSVFSALKKFWLHTGRGDLSMHAPLVEANLAKWDKRHKLKQAKAFTKDELGKLLFAV
jgi:hypothetical protein